ncbi:hypothetical protein PROFUN_02214 [Planoprotostelium fungivorum]|uniref:Palmitoyltransferase n=1 Tax=Planoprotostelium fungivorum TaxID=1890364 RepID=A0A2P6NZG7_9EUKA|nr:hypothetical protein PROFUN_02214 [Planoprotostelium fungivorum]
MKFLGWLFVAFIIGHRRSNKIKMGWVAILLLVVYVPMVIWLAFFLLCADHLKCDSNSKLGRLKYLLTQGVCKSTRYVQSMYSISSDSSSSFLVWLAGPRTTKRAKKAFEYIAYKPNPLLQILYLILVLGGYYLFLRDAFPLLPNIYLGAHHNVGITLYLFYLASANDAGIIHYKIEQQRSGVRHVPTNEKQYSSYPFDDMLYTPGRTCRTCLIERPARSKHCSICDRCIGRFDHHCPWINNCVGENNLRYFLSFVFATASLTLYCGYLCYYILSAEGRIWDMRFRDPETGQTYEASYLLVFQWVMSAGGLVAPLGLFTGIISIVLYGFFAYHIYLIVVNTTTNESYKWYDYVDQAQVKFYMAHKDEIEEQKKVVEAEKTKGKKKDARRDHRDPDWTLADYTIPKYRLDSRGKVVVKNMYNRGWRKNLAEVIWPPSQ